MSTNQVELLNKISKTLEPSNKTYEILQSYYVTKSKRIYKVKNNQYISQFICEKCGLQFSNEICQSHVISANKIKPLFGTQYKTWCGNFMVKVCKLCDHKTMVPLKKPTRVQKQKHNNNSMAITNNTVEHKTNPKIPSSSKPLIKYIDHQNVYSKSKSVFTTRKKEHVVNNHSKKKKDKLAGLCKKAIMEAQKFKETQEAKLKAANKINLFLRTV